MRFEPLCVQIHLRVFFARRLDEKGTRAIPERLRGVFTTRRYTNPRLPLPLAFKKSPICGELPTEPNLIKNWHMSRGRQRNLAYQVW